ncbi:MAG: metal ABC transporter permease [Pseudomonadota bacterium]
MEPFLLRALLAAIGLAIIAAPFGCLVVWNRMAYFGETIAQAGLIGVALSLALSIDLTLGVSIAALAVAALVFALSRQQLVPIDAVLGLTHYGALALGIIATAALSGPSLDLRAYLFGDLFAVRPSDVIAIYMGGAAVLGVLAFIWQPLLRLSVHEDLAAAEGVPRDIYRAGFMALLALTIAFTIKIVGILLVIAFMIVPAVAARAFAGSPLRMVALSATIGVVCVIVGLWGSWTFDAPGGPAIVLTMALAAAASLVISSVQRS